MPVAKLCGRCGSYASRGYGPPVGHADRGTLYACSDHADAAENAWRRRYGLGEHPASVAGAPEPGTVTRLRAEQRAVLHAILARQA